MKAGLIALTAECDLKSRLYNISVGVEEVLCEKERRHDKRVGYVHSCCGLWCRHRRIRPCTGLDYLFFGVLASMRKAHMYARRRAAIAKARALPAPAFVQQPMIVAPVVAVKPLVTPPLKALPAKDSPIKDKAKGPRREMKPQDWKPDESRARICSDLWQVFKKFFEESKRHGVASLIF